MTAIPNGTDSLVLVQGHDGAGRDTFDRTGQRILIDPSIQHPYRDQALRVVIATGVVCDVALVALVAVLVAR